MSTTTPVNFRLPSDLLKAAKKHATKKQTTLSELVRRLLAAEIGMENEPVKTGRPIKKGAE